MAYTGEQYEAEVTDSYFLAGMLLRSNTSITAYASSPAGAIFHLRPDETGAIAQQRYITLGDVRVRSLGQGPDGYLYVLTDSTGRQSRPGAEAGELVRLESW